MLADSFRLRNRQLLVAAKRYASFKWLNNLNDFLLYLNMTKTEIQSEIQKALESVPENVLQDVLAFLKELQEQPEDKVRLTNNLRRILSEDKALLEKLAQ